MKSSGNQAFVNQLLVFTLVMICLSGSVGLGTVWLRHQISVSANETKRLDTEVTRIERRIAETHALIAAEQSPEILDRKNLAMALQLVRPQEQQLVRVAESPEERLLARRNIEIFSDRAGFDPAVSFRLATLR